MLRLKKENELWKVSSVLIFFLLLCTFAFAEKVRIHKAGGGGGTDQVGAVTDDKWCVGDGTLVQCTENAPAGAGNVTAEGFVFDQIPYAVSTTGIAGSANILYNNTNPIFKVSNSNLTVLFSRYADQMYINQTNTTGFEWASGSPTALIWIDDNRAGTTVNEKEEASLVVTGDGTYSAYFEDQVYIGNQITGTTGLWFKGDDNVGYFGIGVDVDSVMAWDLNGAGDDFFSWAIRRQAATDSAVIYLFTDYTNNNPSGDTAHDNYISPTLVMLNSNGADAGDYAAVVMGGRTQSNVAATHYFDFYAMTGASDGGVSAVTTEIPAMFRFGDSGTATSGHSLSSGDVLFEDDIEVDGTAYFDGALDITEGGIEDSMIVSADIKDETIVSADIDDGTIVGGDVEIGSFNLHNQTKSISIYNVTVSHDVLLWQTPKAITLTEVSMVSVGGTDVCADIQECDASGENCADVNATEWQTVTGTETVIDDFADAAIDAGDWLGLKTVLVNGTVSNFAATIKYDE